MPILYWVLVNGTALLLIASLVYEIVIKDYLTSSKRNKRYKQIMDVSNQYRRYRKESE